ncbi:hypothetical protein ES703_38804 [subsurface metagenome]
MHSKPLRVGKCVKGGCVLVALTTIELKSVTYDKPQDLEGGLPGVVIWIRGQGPKEIKLQISVSYRVPFARLSR